VVRVLRVEAFLHGVEGASFLSPKAVSFTPRSFILVSADARAPPVFPLAYFDNQYGGTNEKAFALRAAHVNVGGSFVRISVLRAQYDGEHPRRSG
jgi:hypothetical protein